MDSRRVEDRILTLATEFRDLIERCDKHDLLPTMHSFPRGCCGDASILLARYLADHGEPGFLYVCGERRKQEGGYGSHGWLQRDRLIVDITADQFGEIDQHVIVTDRSAWHDALHCSRHHLADYRDRLRGDPRDLAQFDRTYTRILAAGK